MATDGQIIAVIVTFILAVLGLLQWAIVSMIRDVKEKLDMICGQNDKAHQDIWTRLHHHKHDDCGHVVITGSD